MRVMPDGKSRRCEPAAQDAPADVTPRPHDTACAQFALASDQSPMVPVTVGANIAMNAARNPLPAGKRKGARMPDNFALFAAIILLLPMFYFLLAAPSFLLVKLDLPQVAP